MSIGLLLLIIVFMMIKTDKLVCGVLSYKTASVILLGFPVLSFIQAFLSKYIEAENSFEVHVNDFMFFVFVCTCLSALIGIELKKVSLTTPILLALLLIIFALLATCIQYIVGYFDFTKGQFSSRFVSVQFQYALIAELVSLYAFQIIFTLFMDLFGEDLPSKSKQTSKSKPSSDAPILNV
ncbi:uncharacterized protein LOC135834696 [Planococcus citri]|uniref:uncharacterized protein LOC135834696 n=1 Tax=Planococcus citri TaxID=170843 RepID=UPI0031F95B8B